MITIFFFHFPPTSSHLHPLQVTIGDPALILKRLLLVTEAIILSVVSHLKPEVPEH